MKKSNVTTLLFLLILSSCLLAQDFSGSYILQDYSPAVTLKLFQDDNGNVTGVMNLDGDDYDIEAQQEENELNGFINDFGDLIKFSGAFVDENLQLTIFDPEAAPNEYGDNAEIWVFQRQGEETASIKNENEEVIINGITLTDEQVSELEEMYSAKPLPGNYWYDTNSGLYGVVGYAAYGFMFAGHEFGELDSNASNGDAGVFVNGRQLPQIEWAVWSQLLGYIIQPGRYWLDENGNAGYEGNPIPTENLYAAAQRNSYGGSVGGGDNIWSTRFGAGNYDSNNQRGYVSVPGYGPVGYGF
ncbi:MAG: hypothetical protein JSW63_02310 [Ignavibacterium sp.]|nr:MAG: hypothetical protein JSW63_02310 [Ignavibacterium sp.]